MLIQTYQFGYQTQVDFRSIARHVSLVPYFMPESTFDFLHVYARYAQVLYPYIFGVVWTIVPENVQKPNIQLMPMDVRAAELGRVELKTSEVMEDRSSPDQAC